MVSEELQIAVETLEPKLEEIARNLGQTPEVVLRSALERYEDAQLEALDKIVAHAEASGFETIENTQEEAEKVILAGRQRLGL
jgi:predicted transcriptional regulator